MRIVVSRSRSWFQENNFFMIYNEGPAIFVGLFYMSELGFVGLIDDSIERYLYLTNPDLVKD